MSEKRPPSRRQRPEGVCWLSGASGSAECFTLDRGQTRCAIHGTSYHKVGRKITEPHGLRDRRSSASQGNNSTGFVWVARRRIGIVVSWSMGREDPQPPGSMTVRPMPAFVRCTDGQPLDRPFLPRHLLVSGRAAA